MAFDQQQMKCSGRVSFNGGLLTVMSLLYVACICLSGDISVSVYVYLSL